MNIRLSVGTAAALGLARVKSDALPTTAYLMDAGGKCAHNCSFCSQARGATSKDDKLSRVIWKEFPVSVVMKGLKKAVEEKRILRACVQVTLNKGSYQRTLDIVKAVVEAANVPLSVSANISSPEQVDELMATGAHRVSIALDAATEDLHNLIKNTGWKFKINLLSTMAAKYPGRITTHLIVGLGETEEDILASIQKMYDARVTVGLFAFTPLKGTPMGCCPPPMAGQYRRVQLANWLMKNRRLRFEDLKFSSRGKLLSLGVDTAPFMAHIATGEPFRTAGCAHCNRPYYNESAGHGVMYNYPRPLTSKEAWRALEETELFTPEVLEATFQTKVVAS